MSNDAPIVATEKQQPKRRRRRREGDPEEEPQLRRVCDACTRSKIRCNGETPCDRCSRRSISCEYTFKKRCGPKRRLRINGNNEGRSENLHGEGLLVGVAPLKADSAEAKAKNEDAADVLVGFSGNLGQTEIVYLRVFLESVNAFIPITSVSTIREALSTSPPGPEGGEEETSLLFHARKAILFGAISLGAGYTGNSNEAAPHANRARQEIKECFDATIPELISAYLIMTLHWVHCIDPIKIARYMGLARQSYKDVVDPPAEMAASLKLISVITYSLKMVPSLGCHVACPEPVVSGEMGPSESPQVRLLSIVSFVLISIHRHVVKSTEGSQASMVGVGSRATTIKAVDATREMQGDSMSEMLSQPWGSELNEGMLLRLTSEAEALLSMDDGPAYPAQCLVKALKGYLLLRVGLEREAVGLTEPVVDIFGDNPAILHLPLSWTVAQCMQALLKRVGRLIAVERLDSVMNSLVCRQSFSTKMSPLEQEMMAMYVGKKQGLDYPRNNAGDQQVDLPLPQTISFDKHHNGSSWTTGEGRSGHLVPTTASSTTPLYVPQAVSTPLLASTSEDRSFGTNSRHLTMANILGVDGNDIILNSDRSSAFTSGMNMRSLPMSMPTVPAPVGKGEGGEEGGVRLMSSLGMHMAAASLSSLQSKTFQKQRDEKSFNAEAPVTMEQVYLTMSSIRTGPKGGTPSDLVSAESHDPDPGPDPEVLCSKLNST